MAKSWMDLFNPFQPSGAAERTRLRRERERQTLSDIALQGELARQQEEEARRKEATEKALLELRRGPLGTAIEGALPASVRGHLGVTENPVPVHPFHKKPLMSNDEWLALPRERQMEIFAENEGERWQLERRQAEQKHVRGPLDRGVTYRPTKFSPERDRNYAIESILDSIGGLQQDAKETKRESRLPWEDMLKKDPNLVMRNREAPTGIRKEAAAEHAYRFRTDPAYRKQTWAMPKDLLNPSEVPYSSPKTLGEALGKVYPGLTSERTRPAVPWVSRPTFGTEDDVRREIRSETLTKPVPFVARLYTGKERKDQHEIAQRIANGTATDEDYWRHGHYEARMRIAHEKGYLGKGADAILDMVAYMTEFGVGWSLLGGKAAQATKTGFAKIFAAKAPSKVGQTAVNFSSSLVGSFGSALMNPHQVWATMQEQLPGLGLRRDEENRLIAYMGKDARTAGRKFLDASVQTYFEHAIERWGGRGLIAVPKQGVRGLGFLARKIAGDSVKRAGKAATHNAGLLVIKKSLTGPSGRSWVGRALRKAGFHGFGAEMAEEGAQGWVNQYINPEHFLTTNQANVWTKTRDFVTGVKDERGNPKVTAKEVGDEIIPMALAFLVVGAGGKMMTPEFWQSGDFPEPNRLALEPEGPWKDLLLKEGKEKSDTMVEALEQTLINSVEEGDPREVLGIVQEIAELAEAERLSPSNQNISRSTFEAIKLPGSELTLYDMLKKQEDRKGFLSGITERRPRLASVLESASEAMWERSQDVAGRPVRVGGMPASAVGPDGQPLAALGEEGLGPIPAEAQAEAGVPTMSSLPAAVLGPEGEALVDPRAIGQAPEAPVETPEAEPQPPSVPEMPLEEQRVSGVRVGDLLEGVLEEVGPNESTVSMLREAAEEAYHAEKDKNPKRASMRRNALNRAADAVEGLGQDIREVEDLQSIAGIGKGSAKRIKEHLAGLEPPAPAVAAAAPEAAAPAVSQGYLSPDEYNAEAKHINDLLEAELITPEQAKMAGERLEDGKPLSRDELAAIVKQRTKPPQKSGAASLYEEFGIPENPTLPHEWLGLEEGETNVERIKNRHMELWDKADEMKLGPRSKASQILMNELGQARIKMLKAAEEAKPAVAPAAVVPERGARRVRGRKITQRQARDLFNTVAASQKLPEKQALAVLRSVARDLGVKSEGQSREELFETLTKLEPRKLALARRQRAGEPVARIAAVEAAEPDRAVLPGSADFELSPPMTKAEHKEYQRERAIARLEGKEEGPESLYEELGIPENPTPAQLLRLEEGEELDVDAINQKHDALRAELPASKAGVGLADMILAARAILISKAEEAAAKRGEPVPESKAAREPTPTAEPAAPGKGAADLVSSESLAEVGLDDRWKPLVAMYGIFGGTSASQAAHSSGWQRQDHPINEFVRRTTDSKQRPEQPGFQTPESVNAWVDNLVAGEYSDIWSTPADFFREFDQAVKLLEEAEQDSAISDKVRRALSKAGIIALGDAHRTPLQWMTTHLGEKFIASYGNKRIPNRWAEEMEKALAEPAPAAKASAAPQAAEGVPTRVYHASPHKIVGPLRPTPGRMNREPTGIFFAHTPEEAARSTPHVSTTKESVDKNVTEWEVNAENPLDMYSAEFEDIWREVEKDAEAALRKKVGKDAEIDTLLKELDGIAVVAESLGEARLVPDMLTEALLDKGYDALVTVESKTVAGWTIALDPAIVTRAGEDPAAPEAADPKKGDKIPQTTLKLTKLEKEILDDRLNQADAIYDAIEAEEKGWTLDEVREVAEEFLAGNYAAALESELGREVLVDAHESSPYVGAAEDVTADSGFGTAEEMAEHGLISPQKYRAIKRANDKLGEKLEGFLGKPAPAAPQAAEFVSDAEFEEEAVEPPLMRLSEEERKALSEAINDGETMDAVEHGLSMDDFDFARLILAGTAIRREGADDIHWYDVHPGQADDVEKLVRDLLKQDRPEVRRNREALENLASRMKEGAERWREYRKEYRSAQYLEEARERGRDLIVPEDSPLRKAEFLSREPEIMPADHPVAVTSRLLEGLFGDKVKEIAAEERKDIGPPLVEPGEQLPPGSTTNKFTPEKDQTPEEEQKQKKTHEDEYHEALAANPHKTSFVEDKRPTIPRMVNGIADWYKPELKGEERKAWREEVRGYVDEAHELLNHKYNLLHTDIPDMIYTDEVWKRKRAEARRLRDKGRKRVKDDMGNWVIKEADYSSLRRDEFAQAIRENEALRGMVGDVVGDTSNEESAAYELLITDIPRIGKATPETEEATLELMERSGHTPSWAPEEPESMDRFEVGFLENKVVAGIPSTEGLEEGETVPPVVHGKVVEETEKSVWVETSDGAQYEIDRANLQTFFGESGEEFDFHGEDMGLFSFTPMAAAAIPAYFAAKRLAEWVRSTIGDIKADYWLDRFKDLTKVGGQYGREMWQELQDAEAYVRKVTQEVQYRLADLDVAIKQSPWKRRLHDLSGKQENILNQALVVRPEKLAAWAKENKLPDRLVGPVIAINKLNVRLSKAVAEQLPDIMKDPDFVKNYDYKDLVRTWVSNKSVHLVRVYRAFDDPGWGARIKREHPELVERFRRGIADSLRQEAIEKEATGLFKKGRQALLKDPHYKGLLAKLRVLKKKKKDQQSLLFESNSEKDLMSSLTEVLEPLKSASVKEAAKTVDRRIKDGEILTKEGLDGWVDSYLSPNRVEPRVKKALGQTDMRILMNRKLEDKEFHKIVKRVLGEYTKPSMRVIRSAELLSSFISNRKVQRRLAEEGLEKGWFIEGVEDELQALTPAPRIKRDKKTLHYTKTIPNNISYGALAGLRTTQQFWEGLERHFGREGAVDGYAAMAYRYWMGGVATAKASKTIMNWSTQAMNTITNKMIGIVHGDVSLNPFKWPSQAVSMWEAFGQVWRSAKKSEPYSLSRARGKLENAKTPEAKKKWEKVVREKWLAFEKKYRETVLDRIERGVYFDSPIRELEDMVKEALNSDASIYTHVPEAFDQDMSKFQRAKMLLKRGVTSYWKAHANAYRMGDDYWKGLADAATIRMLDKAYPSHHTRWKGMTSEERRAEIMKEAGLRVRDRYPTSSLSPEVIQLLRRFPIVATFPTWISEFGRTQYLEMFHKDGWMAKDLGSGNPTLRSHARWTYIRWLGAHYGASQAIALIIETVMSLVPGGGPEPIKDEKLIEDLTEGTPPWDRHKTLQWFKTKGKDGKPEYYYNNMSRINPYGRIWDATKAFMGPEDLMDRLWAGTDILAGELISQDMVLGRILAVISGIKPEGGDVYNPESPRWKEQALSYIWQVFKPGEWESLRRLGGISPWKVPHLFGPAGDYFRGWGEADKAGREYNTAVEFLALITPRIGHLKNPKISFDVRASIIAEKLGRINSDIWKSGTNKGWNAEEMFEDSLVNANKRWNLHLQSVGRLVRFGFATGLSHKEMKESIQKKLGIKMKDAKRIVNQAANNETIRIPYELSDKQKDALGPVQRKKYYSDTWRAKKLPFESPIRGLKLLK